MNSTEHLISIVVPVYKVEKYLRRCIESVLSQTYKYYELILVDDGSPDDCPRICDEYANKYENIIVIHQENSGLSAARNSGIEVAKGKYITFIDSDDYVHEKLLEILKNNINKYKVQVSMCSFAWVNDSKCDKNFSLINNTVKIINDQEAMNMLLNEQTTCVAWGKLYHMELFDNIRFPIGKIMEDMFTTPIIFKKAKQLVVDNQKLYYYNQEGTSIIRSEFNYNKLDLVEATYLWKELSDKYYPELSEKAHIHYFSTVLNTCIFLARKTDKFGISIFEKYKKEILINYKYIINSKYTTRNNRIKVILMKYELFRLIMKIKY